MRTLGLILLTLLLLAAAVAAVGYHRYQQFLQAPVFSQLPVTMQIERGDSFGSFISQVQQLNGRTSRWPWKLLGRLDQAHRQLKAGEYEISTAMTPRQLLAYIDGNNVKTYNVTLIEGMQWREIRTLLQAQPVLQQSLAHMSDEDIAAALDIQAPNLEGQFLPETYRFTRGDSDMDILKRAHRDLQDVLQQAWDERQQGLALNSAYDLLILASIIEKETAVGSERERVSGVFNRRLQKNMRLQTDPTVIYGVGEAYAGDITRQHLDTDTPYNTYTRHGLPPTPIALPGAASILAAAQPASGDALYFVADGDGGHRFSATYEAHQQAVQDYLRKTRQRAARQ